MTKFVAFVKLPLKEHRQMSSIPAKIVPSFLANAGTRSIYNVSRNGCRRVRAVTSNNLVPFAVKTGFSGRILSIEIQTTRRSEIFTLSSL